MGYEALELFFAKSEGEMAREEGTLTSVKAGSMAELLSLLKSRALTGEWRVALITPDMLQELGGRGANIRRQTGYEDLIVDAGVKARNHTLSDYVFRQTWVHKPLLQGKIPLIDGTEYLFSGSCLKGIHSFLSDANRHGSSQVCLLAVKS